MSSIIITGSWRCQCNIWRPAKDQQVCQKYKSDVWTERWNRGQKGKWMVWFLNILDCILFRQMLIFFFYFFIEIFTEFRGCQWWHHDVWGWCNADPVSDRRRVHQSLSRRDTGNAGGSKGDMTQTKQWAFTQAVCVFMYPAELVSRTHSGPQNL